MDRARDLDAIKAATRDLHTRAERTGIIAEIVGGRASRYGVALFLGNLLPVYQALEAAAKRVHAEPVLSCLWHPALARSAHLAADVELLHPDGHVPQLPQAAEYNERLSRLSGGALIAHVYVRYLGDLNGGAILKRRITASLGPAGVRLSSYDYPDIEDLAAFTRTYRQALDLALRTADFDTVAEEVAAAYGLNIALSEAVAAASRAE